MGTAITLQLFIAGNSPGSRRARANLEAWGREHGQVSIEVEIIDVFEVPDRALAAGVLLTPQLVVDGPGGRTVIVGDLADTGLLNEALSYETRSA